VGGENIYFKVHSALLHLEGDLAAGYVTVGGENLPAKYVGSLCETVAGCRKHVGGRLRRGSDSFHGPIRFEQAQARAGAVYARIVLEIDRDIRATYFGVFLRRGAYKHGMG